MGQNSTTQPLLVAMALLITLVGCGAGEATRIECATLARLTAERERAASGDIAQASEDNDWDEYSALLAESRDELQAIRDDLRAGQGDPDLRVGYESLETALDAFIQAYGTVLIVVREGGVSDADSLRQTITLVEAQRAFEKAQSRLRVCE